MRDLKKQFLKFHQQNPGVYVLFDHFTWQAVRRGYQHFSAHGILSRIRWETAIETRDRAPYKVNDNYSAFYARMWMDENPKYAGFFRTRGSKADALFEEAA